MNKKEIKSFDEYPPFIQMAILNNASLQFAKQGGDYQIARDVIRFSKEHTWGENKKRK